MAWRLSGPGVALIWLAVGCSVHHHDFGEESERGGAGGDGAVAGGDAAAANGSAGEGAAGEPAGHPGGASSGGAAGAPPACDEGALRCADNTTPSQCEHGHWVDLVVCQGATRACNGGHCATAILTGSVATVSDAVMGGAKIRLVDHGISAPVPICGALATKRICLIGGIRP
jgi:hypothetical protein